MLDNMPRGTICIEDLEIGMMRHLTKQVTDRDIELFAEVSTDRNPVHLDEAYAQDTIFGGHIAHGMLTAGLVSAVIGEQLPGHGPRGFCGLERQQLHARVWPGCERGREQPCTQPPLGSSSVAELFLCTCHEGAAQPSLHLTSSF